MPQPHTLEILYEQPLLIHYNQSLQDPLRYLFKDVKVTYQVLLAAIEETESEYNEVKTSIKTKNAVVEGEVGITELKEKIEALTTVVKSSNIATKTPGSPKPKFRFQKKIWTESFKQPGKRKRARYYICRAIQTRAKPIQCYNCGGWGHGWRNCPTMGNVDWRSLNRAEPPPTRSVLAPGPPQKSQ